MTNSSLPIPEFFEANKVGAVWRFPFEERAKAAQDWANTHGLQPAAANSTKTWLMLIDVQNTFCIPDFELYVGGRSGRGAVEDNVRLCEFIYRHLSSITKITATMDTHKTMQVFHAIFFVDKDGNHPVPYTDIHAAELREGGWTFNAALASQFGIAPEYGQQMVIDYAEKLEKSGKYTLTIWPYHAMLGSVGHALVSSVAEALFFHSVARLAQTDIVIKGEAPFTENYSVIGPEVLTGPMDERLGTHDQRFVQQLQEVDRLIIAGQARRVTVWHGPSTIYSTIFCWQILDWRRKFTCWRIVRRRSWCPAWSITPTRQMPPTIGLQNPECML